LIEKKLELKALSKADALVTLAHLAAETLKRLHGREVYTITNGFDPEKMNDGKTRVTSKFTITYTGQIYKGKQDPTKLLAALKNLTSNGTINPRDVEIRFYGPENKLLQTNIERYGLSKIAKQYGVIPREVSFQKQRESQLLLLLNWEDPREKSVYTLKIFEYLAAHRPILATGGFGNDVVQMLLNETNSGIYCSTVKDISNNICHLYSEYKTAGRVSYYGSTEKINQYSYRETAKKFADILNNLLRHEQTKRKVEAINNRKLILDRDGKAKQRILKEDLYDNLRSLGEKGFLKLLDDENVRLSLRSVQYEHVQNPKGLSQMRIFGNYTHIVEGLIRAAWCSKEKHLNLFVSTIRI